MIKTIHLISSLALGGRERQLTTILNNSSNKLAHKAIVFNRLKISYAGQIDLTSQVTYLTKRKSYQRFLEIYKLIQQEKPDIIWSWGGYEATFGITISCFTKVRHINGSIRHGVFILNKKQIWRNLILRLSKYRVANNFAGLKANGLKKGFVLYNGIDPVFFQNKVEYNTVKQDLNLRNSFFTLVSVANLVPYKDYYTVLKALEKFKKTIEKRFYYLIIGDGPERFSIENYIKQLDLVDNVILLGSQNDINKYLRIADLFIHSSKGEGASNAILEAMANGLRIIATNTGGTKEIIHPKHSALFKYKDSSSLYNQISKMYYLEEKDSKNEIVQYTKARFSVDVMLDNYLDILKKVKNGKSTN